MTKSILKGKRILAVDDEQDILETLSDLLSGYEGLILDTAADYTNGYQMLRSWTYDAVILDIMGVRGFDLLNAAVHLGFPTVMLTAHAFSIEDLKRSIEMGARAYIPKESMADIAEFLEDLLTLSHSSGLKRMFHRLGGVFDKKFGSRWMEREKTYWDKVASGNYLPQPVILDK
jgi:CheY-like chemotaxis protein